VRLLSQFLAAANVKNPRSEEKRCRNNKNHV
jgi:hypothetical protein